MIETDEAGALAFLECRLWPNGPVCPRCGESKKIETMNGQSTRPGTRRCRSCRRKFHVTTDTVMRGSHVPLSVWLKAFDLVRVRRHGTIRVGRACGLSSKSALFLVRRIRRADREASAILHACPPDPHATSTRVADETQAFG